MKGFNSYKLFLQMLDLVEHFTPTVAELSNHLIEDFYPTLNSLTLDEASGNAKLHKAIENLAIKARTMAVQAGGNEQENVLSIFKQAAASYIDNTKDKTTPMVFWGLMKKGASGALLFLTAIMLLGSALAQSEYGPEKAKQIVAQAAQEFGFPTPKLQEPPNGENNPQRETDPDGEEEMRQNPKFDMRKTREMQQNQPKAPRPVHEGIEKNQYQGAYDSAVEQAKQKLASGVDAKELLKHVYTAYNDATGDDCPELLQNIPHEDVIPNVAAVLALGARIAQTDPDMAKELVGDFKAEMNGNGNELHEGLTDSFKSLMARMLPRVKQAVANGTDPNELLKTRAREYQNASGDKPDWLRRLVTTVGIVDAIAIVSILAWAYATDPTSAEGMRQEANNMYHFFTGEWSKMEGPGTEIFKESNSLDLMHLPADVVAWLYDRPEPQMKSAKEIGIAAQEVGNEISRGAALRSDTNVLVLHDTHGKGKFHVYPDGSISFNGNMIDGHEDVEKLIGVTPEAHEAPVMAKQVAITVSPASGMEELADPMGVGHNMSEPPPEEEVSSETIESLEWDDIAISEESKFKKLSHKLAHQKGIHDPDALAASIGRKKYGKKGMVRKARAAESISESMELTYDDLLTEGKTAEKLKQVKQKVLAINPKAKLPKLNFAIRLWEPIED